MNGALQTLQILSDRKTMEILSDHQTREILAERDKKMERNARLINQTGKYAFALSLGASLFAAPLVFGTIAVTSIIIGALNRKATDQGHYNTEMAFNAVNICTDPTRNLEDKKAAFALLEKTNNHIRQWEEINAIAGTIIKTGAKEVASRLGGGLAADVTDEVIKKYTAKEKTSVKMDRALEAFKEEIGLSQPSELKRDKLPSADFHIN
ncbi:MAG: hypothetical protein JWM96_563 [Alphaproteobacteria bacterium]|nr:hypothetical protein [Alphaproteobacteria bacterium]